MDYGCCCIRPTVLNDFEFNGVNTEPAMATSSNTPQPQDEGLRKFLQSRGIPEENIQKMLQDRIDTSVVEEIDDDTLAAYIPAYGDRIATRRFCMEKKTTGGVDSKRLSMFEKLKSKMYTKSNKDRHQDSEEEHSNMHLRNNRRASKMTRKIEIGWINDKRQVRKRNGGGTRLLDISKTATKKDILSHAKGLFFPNEKSIHGIWEEFSHDIVDFQEANLEDSISVRELYEAQKFGVLRFYLFTEHLTNREDITEMGEGADKQTDEDKQQKKTAENVEQLRQKTPDSKQQSHTVEEDGQSTNKMSAQSERDLLSTALQEALVGDDEDEFLDLMDRMGVRTVPTQENLKAVLLQVAHKQIIQQPKYALDNIAAVAGPTLRKFFPSVLEIHKMYDDLRPTTRKVLKLITASPNTASENQTLLEPTVKIQTV
ncbi:uncharacterized protein LOC128462122 [Pleuronectes platessa]|uniref:uncharacterized protein LOC128462122 n=1 Tax=Pleuronectes platessa TaxID=8262 RepID=UPI00232A70FD|nr:uncharacterized protein LOC128462122 [Pleuronectes platessa]